MEISGIRLVYFSATYTTRKIVRAIASEFGAPVHENDITLCRLSEKAISDGNDIITGTDELLVVGMPVYAGRIPSSAAATLRQFKGKGTPAIIVCVYGNRDYDDALVEMADILEENGFKVFSAAAFIAQHSIFPKVGKGRPDDKDMAKIKDFALESKKRIDSACSLEDLSSVLSSIKGNRPYKIPGSIPIIPTGDRKCSSCLACVKVCPVKAISSENPRKTDDCKCIKCGRCVTVCPEGSRKFRGLLYRAAEMKFVSAYSDRKEPEIF